MSISRLLWREMGFTVEIKRNLEGRKDSYYNESIADQYFTIYIIIRIVVRSICARND